MNPEPIGHVLKKRDSLACIWELMEVKPQYRDKDTYTQFACAWNKLSYRRQQQYWWFLNEKKKRGEVIYDNPLYNLSYVHPHPYDWNEKRGIEDMVKSGKMVSACYNGHFGVYTRCEATIFEMTHVTPMRPFVD